MELLFLYATLEDIDYLKKIDTHITFEKLKKKVLDKEVIIVKNKNINIGVLRFGYFWDTIPFMNLLLLKEEYRNKKIGKELVLFWEKEMKKNKHKRVMTSTQADEEAQHFYRKIGYKDIGALFEINNGPAEIFLSKKL